ncbi:MAG TPA: signal peptidase I [Methylomirabilota bacterium]|jgi:signal peptidase I|nr:signal peptidase I [Methylomirabilota bacterium]
MSDPEKQSDNKSFFSHFASSALLFWDFAKIVIVALIIIIPIRYFVFQPFIVSGSSMVPNFQNGQYLVIDELSYHFSQPKRGDVIVLKHHNIDASGKDHQEFYIKRLIGLPGETVKIDNNGSVIIINAEHPEGSTINEPYLPSQSLTYVHNPTIIGGNKVVTLGADEYFMLGDNRLASSDSRDWGVLKRSDMVGKTFLRLLPLNTFEFYFKDPVYSF